MSIARELSRRGIAEVIHFTTNRGLVGMLAQREVLSRRRLPAQKYLENILYPNAAIRPEDSEFFDKSLDWLDYVNLSISEINQRFFAVSRRWHRDKDIWWVILAFDPAILEHEGVYFATTNNKYSFCIRESGEEGFDALFGPKIRRLPNWTASRGARGNHLPTCEQAEVLYPGALSLRYLRSIYVESDDDFDRVRGWVQEFGYPEIAVKHDVIKFKGVPN